MNGNIFKIKVAKEIWTAFWFTILHYSTAMVYSWITELGEACV
jgi:hypothetical protein